MGCRTSERGTLSVGAGWAVRGRGAAPPRGRLPLVPGSCRDEKTQTLHAQNESWLRPGLRGNRVEYCRCVGGRPHCHSVPVKSTSALPAGASSARVPTPVRPAARSFWACSALG